MNFLITFFAFDTTVSDDLLSAKMSAIRHTVIDSGTTEYYRCESIRDIEAVFERRHNYIASNDDLTAPHCKVKVVKVEPLPPRQTV
jgi:hypothetical protein